MLTFKLFGNDKIVLSNYERRSKITSLQKNCDSIRDYNQESISRAKRKIFEYGISNEWTHFLTITFDPKKFDRFDLLDIKSKFIKYLKNYSRVDSSFKYLVIPELHKNGALHFHGLVYFSVSSEKYLKHFKGTIFNHKLFNDKFGFNRFIKIIDFNPRVINYILKYVSKDCKRIFRNFYFHSQALSLCPSFSISSDVDCLEEIKKIETLCNCEIRSLYSNKYVSIYSFEKSSYDAFFNYYYNIFTQNIQVKE